MRSNDAKSLMVALNFLTANDDMILFTDLVRLAAIKFDFQGSHQDALHFFKSDVRFEIVEMIDPDTGQNADFMWDQRKMYRALQQSRSKKAFSFPSTTPVAPPVTNQVWSSSDAPS